MAIEMEWEPEEVQDHTPRKGLQWFTDYTWKDYRLEDYKDSWHLFKKKKYVARFRTWRLSLQAVRWLEGEALPTPRKRNKSIILKK